MADDSPYIAQLGRISGKLLSANLLRDGEPLFFKNRDTDTNSILELDVNNFRIGVNTVPTLDLDVNNTIYVRNNLIVDGSIAKIDNIIFNTNNTITSEVGPIEIQPTGVDTYVVLDRALTTNFEIKGNYISGVTLNDDMRFVPSGTGIVNFQSNTRIEGGLTVTGNITADGDLVKNGNIIIGDNPDDDTLQINTDLTQDIIPGIDDFYTLGTVEKPWLSTWISGYSSINRVNINNLIISDQTLLTGHTISTINSNDDLFLTSNTNNVVIEELNFSDNVITNLDATTPDQTPLQLEATGTGYIKFADTTAMRIPVGTTAERVGKEVGETRWNTDLGYLECFDGTVWQVATGGGIIVTSEIQQELSEIYTLVFG